MFALALGGARLRYKLGKEQRNHPLRDDWWRALVPALDAISVPALICGSFSDNDLHGRGSFRGWEGIASTDRFLYTHRGGKWLTFYSPEAGAAQLQFFDRYLRGRDVPAPPRIRLEVRESRDVVASVREEQNWPLDGTEWRPLYLTAEGLAATPPARRARSPSAPGPAAPAGSGPCPTTRKSPARWPCAWVEARGADDVDLFAGVEKWREPGYVPFEGSYGFGRDRVTTGWLKASLRALDDLESRPFEPVPACTRREPLAPGQIVARRYSARPVSHLLQDRGHAAACRRRPLAMAVAQPAHRPVPGRLPAGPEGRMHRALGTGTTGPAADPCHRAPRVSLDSRSDN